MTTPSPVDIVHGVFSEWLGGQDIRPSLAEAVTLEVDQDVPHVQAGLYRGPDAFREVLRTAIPHPRDVETRVGTEYTGRKVRILVDDYCLWVGTDGEGRIEYAHLMTLDGSVVRSMLTAYQQAVPTGDYMDVYAFLTGNFQYHAGSEAPVTAQRFFEDLGVLLKGRQFSVDIKDGDTERDVEAVITVGDTQVSLFFDLYISSGKICAAFYPSYPG